MTKLFTLFTSLFILLSCATKEDRKPVLDSKKHKMMTFEEKKESIKAMVSAHNEFSNTEKKSIETLLIDALNQTEKLRKRESQLIQEILNQTIVKKGSYDQLLNLKKELKKIYLKKYENFENSIKKLKEIVGIEPKNKSLSNDISFEQFVERR